MPVYQDAKNRWYVQFSYTENGEVKTVKKRGFSDYEEGVSWEAITERIRMSIITSGHLRTTRRSGDTSVTRRNG